MLGRDTLVGIYMSQIRRGYTAVKSLVKVKAPEDCSTGALVLHHTLKF